MLAPIARIYGYCLSDRERAKEYADRMAAINPGASILRIAYRHAGIRYNPREYEDVFRNVAEKLPSKPAEKEIGNNTVSITVTPNPFNPTTTLTYYISKPGRITVDVYAVSGQKVTTLVNGVKGPGTYSIEFDGSNLAAGVYLYRFKSTEYDKTGKMLLVK